MGNFQTFEQFLATQSVQMPILPFVLNLLIASILASILGFVYIKYGRSISNRKQFAQQFVLLAMTTMLIISIVKSSLALSLGLVGALSIVRYRAAIKEPEELTYLFLAIAIGLGTGADQKVITIVAFTVIISVLMAKSILVKTDYSDNNLFLTIVSKDKEVNIDEIILILNKYCAPVDMKRFDETADTLETTFLVKINEVSELQGLSDSLRKVSPSMKISFLDTQV